MKLNLKQMVRKILLGSSFLILIFSVGSPSIVSGGASHAIPSRSLSVTSRETDRLQVLSVLADKMEDQRLFGKARDKLSALSDRQMRLIASLSDRILNEGKTAGADIAFLLITALIILS